MRRGRFRRAAARFAFSLVAAFTSTGLAMGERMPIASGDARVTPAFARVFVPGGETRTHRVMVETDEIQSLEPLDVLFLMDCSASMDHQLDPVRGQVDRMLELVRRRHPDVRFGVASFSDYAPLHSKNPRDYPWRLDRDFTSDPLEVRAALDRIRILDGGDGPESYARALFEAGRLGWRERARKVIVLFGDSVGHARDPGPDAIPGTPDDLRVEDVARDLAARGVRVIGVYEPKAPAVREQFEMLASITHGQAIALRDGGQAPAAALAGLSRSLRVPVGLNVPEEHRSWIPEVGVGVSLDAEASEFTVTLAAPAGVVAGRHGVELVAYQVTGNRAEVGRARVEIVTGWLNDPSFQFRVAAALALLPLVALAWRALGRDWTVDAYYFNRGQRWWRLARTATAFVLLSAWLGGIAWAYGTLLQPETAPLSELLANFGRQGNAL